MPATLEPKASSRAVFAYRGFTLFVIARFLTVSAAEMQSVAVGWQIYEITKRPLDLGLVGLAQFLPSFFLFLVSGHVADRFPRRKILLCCFAAFTLCSALLLIIALHGSPAIWPMYVVLLLIGAVRAFNQPATHALLPQIVPEEHFPSAVAWGQTGFQSAIILGPAIGGLIYSITGGPAAVYATAMGSFLIAIAAMAQITTLAKQPVRRDVGLKGVLAGFKYVWQQKLLLGTMSLDLFAVLLGGVTALLPVFAKEILRTGPLGLGLLRSAPGAGATVMAIVVAHMPVRRKAGATMLWCVAGFGVCTIVFGLSRNLVFSLIVLFILGASDMVSVIIRGTLVQLATPDDMRGRVTAVNSLFVGASNEFGQFESGVTAQWFGTVPAVLLGGVGTLLVVALWAWRFPELRRADRLTTAAAAD
jgi:MFS family permease